MAVTNTPPITFTDLRNEFGGGPSDDLGAYVRGGAFVPDGPPQNAQIPTAPPISLGDFYGSIKQNILLTPRYVTGPPAAFELWSNGTTQPPKANEWALVQYVGLGADYDCRCDVTLGTTPSGPIGAWTSLASNVVWSIDAGYTEMTVQIRDANTLGVLVAAPITLDALPP